MKAFPIAQALFKNYLKELYLENIIDEPMPNKYIRNTKITKSIAERFSLKVIDVNTHALHIEYINKFYQNALNNVVLSLNQKNILAEYLKVY